MTSLNNYLDTSTAADIKSAAIAAQNSLRPATDKDTHDTSKNIFPLISHFFSLLFAKMPRFFSIITALFGIHIFLRAPLISYRNATDWTFNFLKYIIIFPESSISWGVALMILSGALAYRKRIGWIALMGIFTLALLNDCEMFFTLSRHKIIPGSHKEIPLHLLHVTNYHSLQIIGMNICIIAIFIGLLLSSYRIFNTKVRRGNIPLALGVLIFGTIFISALGTFIYHFAVFPESSVQLFKTFIVRTLGFSNLHDLHDIPREKVLNTSAIAYVAALIVLLRSQQSSNAMTPSDDTVVRRLNSIFGNQDSLSYYATRRDKAIVWSPNALSAITYRVEIGVCIASADPIGEKKSWPLAINEWLQLCNEFGWTPAVEGASKTGAIHYEQAGLKSWLLGDEAIIYTQKFTLSGAKNKSLRQAVNRARRAGLKIRVRHQNELNNTELQQLETYIDSWRVGGQERGFSMALGRFGDRLDPRILLVEAYKIVDGKEIPMGILSFVPWGNSGISLDVMRRNPTSPNGTVEFMVSELALNHQKYGINRISLNFAMLRRVFAEGADIGGGPVFNIWHKILLFFSRFWQLESLYNSSAKYNPVWNPRYVCYPSTVAIPKVGIAIAIAEGFLSLSWRHRKKHSSDPEKYTGLYPQVPPAALEADFLTGPEFNQYTKLIPKRPEQVAVRISKVELLRELGIDPFPPAIPPSHSIAQAKNLPLGTAVSIAGRLNYIRSFGGVLFAILTDWTGSIQIIIEQSARTKFFKKLIDLGDFLLIKGIIGHSRTDELSILTHEWIIQAKSLHPLPAKHKGLTDPEAKIRLRHVDLATSPDARSTLLTRSMVISSIRNTLDLQGYIEVETPILQKIHGGANATPFNTHINAYNQDLYLRIATELYLKRLIVGGMEKVYELGKQFRNEGTDATHNPEFTSLEAYMAYGDYHIMRTLAQEIIQHAAVSVHGEQILLQKNSAGTLHALDISGNWPVVSVLDALSERIGKTITVATEPEILQRICKSFAIPYLPRWNSSQLIVELYEHLLEKTTTAPTFYADFPVSVSPLTRHHRSKPHLAERWDLVISGMELATAYTELTDPLEQRRRLTEQSLLASAGDAEAMQLDEDFLTALEFAMPPTGGLGIGVDRLIMLITGKNIRETLLFPFTKDIN